MTTNRIAQALLAISLLSFVPLAESAPVDIIGTITNTSGNALEGTISVFHESPAFRVDHRRTEKDGSFKFEDDSTGGLVIVARAAKHPTAEHHIADGKSGTVAINFVLPVGQDIHGRITDGRGDVIPDAAVQVRYVEPDKPTRRVLYGRDIRTDSEGNFFMASVGIGVPFYLDVYAPSYLAKTSQELKLSAGQNRIRDIVLDSPVGTVSVRVVDKSGAPVANAEVTMLADKANLPEESFDSWLHFESFHQLATTSALGSVRFTGVSPGTDPRDCQDS